MALTENKLPVSAGVVGGKTTIEDSSITDTGTGVVVNDAGIDADFRIESDTNANAFALDGATGYVSLGTNTSPTNLAIWATDTSPRMQLYRNDATIASGNELGSIWFGGSDAPNNTAARIKASADATWSAGSSSSRLTFDTTPTGSLTTIERMRIDNTGLMSGQVLATQNTHSEIGDLLDTLTAPVAIVGFTGTGASASTETGYENGAGRTWTYSGGAASDKITEGNAYVYSFDGTDSYMSTPDTADMSFDDSGDNPFSAGGWVQWVTGTYPTIISKWDATSGTTAREWTIQSDASGKVYFYLYDESADKSPHVDTDTSVLSDGDWHFVLITYDSAGGAAAADGGKIYIDGLAVAITPTNDADYVGMENLGASPIIGARTGNSAIERLWTGDMGRLFVTAEELTAADVWKLYEKTRGYYNL